MALSFLSTALSTIKSTCPALLLRAANLSIQRPLLANYSVACNKFPSIQTVPSLSRFAPAPARSLLVKSVLQQTVVSSVPSRSVTKWSLTKGKRKSVRAVVDRFYRLEWGAWIRTVAGRNKKKWRKTGKRLDRGKKHLFCNATQSTLLDKMVTKFWRRRRFYIEDPYEPYHSREQYPLTARKPH